MDNRRGDIDDMQLAIDEHHYTIKRHSEMIGEIHGYSKQNAENIVDLAQTIKKHVKKEDDQDKRQEALDATLMNLVTQVTPLDDIRNEAASFVRTMKRIKGVIAWIAGISVAVVAIYKVIREYF